MTQRDLSKRQRALDALAELRHYGSIRAVSGAIGVPIRTLARWRQDPAFQAELRERMPHAPAEIKSDGTGVRDCQGSGAELPADSGAVLSMVMRELHAIGTDPKNPGYCRTQALRALADLTIEHRTVSELQAQLDELREGR